MDDLPLEMYQLIARFMPAEDLRSMRLVNRTAVDSLEREMYLRASPFRFIRDTSLQGLQRFEMDNIHGRFNKYITTLLIDEDEFRRSLRNITGDHLVTQSLSRIFHGLSKLTTIIWKVDPNKEKLQAPGVVTAYALAEERPLTVFLSALQGLRLKIYIAGREFEFTVYWEGSKVQTDKIRLIGGGPPGQTRLAPIAEPRRDVLTVACNNVMDHFCASANAVHVSCLDFEDLSEQLVLDWFTLGLEMLVNFPEALVFDNCSLIGDMPWDNIMQYKSKLTIKNSKIDYHALDWILELAADPQASPNLERLYIQDLHNFYFRWADGVVDFGAHLQSMINRFGLRAAAEDTRQSIRRWSPRNVFGDRYRHEQPLRRVWNMDDPRERQTGHNTQDQNFRAHHRR